MSFERPLQGGCQCGRNRYIIQFPNDAGPRQHQLAQVLFNSHPSHRSSLATPLPAYLRVPLAYYHSNTQPYFPDETRAQIRRVYTSPHEQHAMRHFCGFCGTPLSYWSEDPHSEADFIQLALGSLSARDLADLEELGFVPGSEEEEEGQGQDQGQGGQVEGVGAGKGGEVVMVGTTTSSGVGDGGDHFGTVGAIPWLDSLTEGSRLGTLRRAKGRGTNRTGTVRVEWEVAEWSEDDVPESPRKRKIEDVEERRGPGKMEGGQH